MYGIAGLLLLLALGAAGHFAAGLVVLGLVGVVLPVTLRLVFD